MIATSDLVALALTLTDDILAKIDSDAGTCAAGPWSSCPIAHVVGSADSFVRFRDNRAFARSRNAGARIVAIIRSLASHMLA